MAQELGLYILFKRTLSVCFAALIFSFLLIEVAGATSHLLPPPVPDPTVPAGGPWGYLALISGIVVYAKWSRKKSKNRPPEDES